jgi:hypothetical protein
MRAFRSKSIDRVAEVKVIVSAVASTGPPASSSSVTVTSASTRSSPVSRS